MPSKQPKHSDASVSLALESIARAQNTLIESGVLFEHDGVLVWREGHLLHIARQFVTDETSARRNYADDLAVAEQLTPGEWQKALDLCR